MSLAPTPSPLVVCRMVLDCQLAMEKSGLPGVPSLSSLEATPSSTLIRYKFVLAACVGEVFPQAQPKTFLMQWRHNSEAPDLRVPTRQRWDIGSLVGDRVICIDRSLTLKALEQQMRVDCNNAARETLGTRRAHEFIEMQWHVSDFRASEMVSLQQDGWAVDLLQRLQQARAQWEAAQLVRATPHSRKASPSPRL